METTSRCYDFGKCFIAQLSSKYDCSNLEPTYSFRRLTILFCTYLCLKNEIKELSANFWSHFNLHRRYKGQDIRTTIRPLGSDEVNSWIVWNCRKIMNRLELHFVGRKSLQKTYCDVRSWAKNCFFFWHWAISWSLLGQWAWRWYV